MPSRLASAATLGRPTMVDAYRKATPPAGPGIPALLDHARSAALRLLAINAAVLVVGFTLLGIGVASGSVLIAPGAIVLASALLLAPTLVSQVLDPTRTFSNLGKSRKERHLAVAEAIRELNTSNTTRFAVSTATVYVSPRWFFLRHEHDAVLALREDVLWVWFESRTKRRWGRSPQEHRLRVWIRGEEAGRAVSVDARDQHALAELADEMTETAFGADPRLAALSKEQLAAEIDRRRAHARS